MKRPIRHWLRFSLRGLLVFFFLAAVLMALIGRKIHAVSRQRSAVAEIQKCGGTVVYGYDIYDPNKEDAKNQNPMSYVGTPPGPAWLRGLFGDDVFAHVVFVDLSGLRVIGCRDSSYANSTYDGQGLTCLLDLPRLDNVMLSNTQVGDADLETIAKLTQLDTLSLDGTHVTDVGLAHLAGMSHLRSLTLDNTSVTDKGLRHLGQLNNLEFLWLHRCKLSEKGLVHLQLLVNLQQLDISDTQVTNKGVEDLQAHLPDCTIIY